jgi:hypothetical protein
MLSPKGRLCKQLGAFCIYLAMSSNGALAEELQWNFESIRARGRGNAYVASYWNEEALRHNPASVAEKTDYLKLDWFQADMIVGDNTINTISSLIDSVSSGATANGLLDSLSSQFGKRLSARAQLFPLGLRIMRVSVVPYMTSAHWFEMRTPPLPEVKLNSDTRLGAILSYSIGLGKNMYAGFNVRPYTRILAQGDISMIDIISIAGASGQSQLDEYLSARTETMIGFDVGLLWVPKPNLRFGLMSQDVGDTTGTSTKTTTLAPSEVKNKTSIGMYYRKDFKGWNLDWGTDVHDIFNRQGVNILRLISTGVEFGKSFYGADQDVGVQMGLSEGYLSFGAFLDLWLVRAQFANYGVEAGATPGQRLDRRWAGSLSSSMTF